MRFTPIQNQILEQYKPMADFIGEVAGSRCEVVLRDYQAGSSRILYIVNPSVSGRVVGEVTTGYRLRKIVRDDAEKVNHVSNYRMVNEGNQRVYRASAYYIKENGKLIGLLCVNYDLTDFLKMRDFIDEALLFGALAEDGRDVSRDYFDENMDGILEGIIRNVFMFWDRSIPAKDVETEGNPIRQLYRMRVFNYKGSVNRVAEILGISTQSVYRYMKEAEKIERQSKRQEGPKELNLSANRRNSVLLEPAELD